MSVKFDNLKLYGIDSTKIAVAIIAFSSIVAIILLLISPFCRFCYKTSPGFWSNFIGSCIAIANALLLYATLKSHNSSFERERFENNFYKMLDVHQGLTNQICLGQNSNICGRIFFDFFSHEMKAIKNSLSSNHYLGTYNQDNVDKEFMAIEYQYESKLSSNDMDAESWRKEMEDKTQKEHTIRLTNTRYSITETEWKKYKDATINNEIAYPFFYNKWYSIYEHYIRSVIYVLTYINENANLNKDIYILIISVQCYHSMN